MSKRDIRPFLEHRLRAFPLLAGADFLDGEPVVLLAGELHEANSDPPSLSGIAAVPSAVNNAQSQIAVQAAGTLIQVYDIRDTLLFQSENFATDGAGTLVAPTVADIGLAGLTLTAGGQWVVDSGTANLILEIEQVLSSDGRPISGPVGASLTGDKVVFRFL